MLREKVRHIISIVIVVMSFVWMVIPMFVLQGDYCFTIHDGMDSYAGIVQFVHDNHLYFNLNQNLPIMNGIEGKYTFLGFNLYDFLNCLLGFVWGQVLTRIIGCTLGFFSFRHLMNYIYQERSSFFDDVILVVSALYIITPVSPLRMMGFASLPLVIEFYLYLQKSSNFLKLSFLGIIFPVLSVFDALFLFVLAFWLLFSVIDTFKNKHINMNLLVSFCLMSFCSMVVNYNFFLVALVAGETSREIYVDRLTSFKFDWSLFEQYFFEGQYHATAYPKWILMPVCMFLTIYIIAILHKNELKNADEKKSVIIILIGWLIPFLGALIMTCQESGLRSGILLIDGFQWGRIIAFSRFTWICMLLALVYMIRDHKILRTLMCCVILFQLIYVINVRSVYNDTYYSVINRIVYNTDGYEPLITYNDFASKDLFEEIKYDIHYDGAGVVAYGFHPSVLLLNNFNTIDGYFTVHSMELQNQFREIIAPALDRMEYYREYYDTWGGRMYIYGPLSYEPTKEKEHEPVEIYIDINAYKKYGGKYVLSRAMISNASEQRLEFVNDYDTNNSLYHIYLYRVEE